MSERQTEIRRAMDEAGLIEGAVVKILCENERFAIMIDCSGVGRKQSMLVRCVRFVPVNYTREELTNAVEALARDVRSSAESAHLIGVKF